MCIASTQSPWRKWNREFADVRKPVTELRADFRKDRRRCCHGCEAHEKPVLNEILTGVVMKELRNQSLHAQAARSQQLPLASFRASAGTAETSPQNLACDAAKVVFRPARRIRPSS